MDSAILGRGARSSTWPFALRQKRRQDHPGGPCFALLPTCDRRTCWILRENSARQVLRSRAPRPSTSDSAVDASVPGIRGFTRAPQGILVRVSEHRSYLAGIAFIAALTLAADSGVRAQTAVSSSRNPGLHAGWICKGRPASDAFHARGIPALSRERVCAHRVR